MKSKLIWSFAIVLLYLLIKYIVPHALIVLYPIALMVTILHELGHAFTALITGGDVYAVHINPDGSGFAKIAGGLTALVLMGGYIGSAFFGNLFIYIAISKPRISKITVIILSIILVFTSFWWFSSIVTSIILLLFAAILIYFSKKSQITASYVLLVTGILSLLYIIEDYNVGPSSDIHKFSTIVKVLPEQLLAYGFLLIVLIITFFNFRTILRHARNS